jgi:hypothetical protein
MADDTNDKARNREFLMLADQFIQLANERLSGHDASMISAAFMFASSRFCAFSIAAQLDDPIAFEREKSAALEHYSREYHNMLEQNLNQHHELLTDAEPDDGQ